MLQICMAFLLIVTVVAAGRINANFIEDSTTLYQTDETPKQTSSIPVMNKCNDKWYYFNYTTYCYRAYSGKNWMDSEVACVEEGGHLASIHSAEEAFFIVDVTLKVVPFAINYTYSLYDQQVWIGLYAADKWQNWKWSDGSSTYFIKWSINEPDSSGIENCAQLMLSGNILESLFHTLNDYNCSGIQKAFVCKMPSSDTPTLASTISTPAVVLPNSSRCQYGWYFYAPKKSCYRAYPGENWENSKAACVEEGGHLASIHSANETAFVVEVINQVFSDYINETYSSLHQQVWIGLYTIDDNENWNWTDDSPTDYLDWASSEPNNPGKENCTQLVLSSDGNNEERHSFNNYDCTVAQKAYVCKMPSINIPTTLNPTNTSYSTSVEVTSPVILTKSQPLHPSNNFSKKWYIIVGVIFTILILITVLTIYIFQKKRREAIFHKNAQETIRKKLESSPLKLILSQNDRLKMQIDSKNVHLDLDMVLGRGANAIVYQASISGESKYHHLRKSAKMPQYQDCKAALKLPMNFNADEVENYVRELDALIIFGSHPHIIAFLGWSIYGETPTLITEKAEMNLLTYVKSLRGKELPYRNILSILWQISQALEHVAANSMIHRDVAARNILMTESTVAKLADFGLCCHFDETFSFQDNLQQQRFPFKWLSMEALVDRKFSEKSDVWSFGILCYEIFVYGSVPYPAMTNIEMFEFLQSGKRLEKPLIAPDAIYELMLACWAEDPGERSTFQEISRIFRNMLENETAGYGYLSIVE